MNPMKIDSYRNSEIIQVCHIQVASRDSDVFEYAIDQVRDHVARQYGEYLEICRKLIISHLGENATDKKIRQHMDQDVLFSRVAV